MKAPEWGCVPRLPAQVGRDRRTHHRLVIGVVGGQRDPLPARPLRFADMHSHHGMFVGKRNGQATRLSDGSRKVVSIAEITGMEGSVVQLQEIFKFERTGTAENGKVQGHFVATGLRPKFLDEMERKGVFMPAGMFDPSSRF